LDRRSELDSTDGRTKPLGCVFFEGMDALRDVYAAFNARDIDGALALMHPDVDWPNGWEGGREVGLEAVRDYWQRQWAEIDSHVEPLGFTEAPDGRIAVDVRQTVRDYNGKVLSDGRVTHVYTLRDGLVTRMDIVARS
jgi:ketosteroid isomerase-like protein